MCKCIDLGFFEMRKKIRSEDIPAEVLMPDDWPLWRATAVRDGKHCESTFIRSQRNEEQHIADLGKRALRMLGVRGRYSVKVSRYFPWLDPAISGHVIYVR